MLLTLMWTAASGLSTRASAIWARDAPVMFTPTSSPGPAPTMNPNFFGFHYELSSWAQFGATCVDDNHDSCGTIDYSKNQFSDYLYHVATSRTGGTPIIRLGGTTTDYATYHQELTQPVVPQITRKRVGKYRGAVIGPEYWKLCTQFSDIKFVVQVPIGYQNGSEWNTWANAAYDAMGSQIEAIEIGKEPNFYNPAQHAMAYSKTYLSILADIQNTIPSAPKSRYYQAFDTGYVGSSNPATSLLGAENLTEAFDNFGIDSNGSIRQVGWHFYPHGGSLQPGDMQSTIFNHPLLVSELTPITVDLQLLNNQPNPIPFIWSEIALAIKGLPGVVNNFGTAMWNIDCFLYSMALGVDSIHYSENMANFFLFWLPQKSDGEDAQVYAPFYSIPLVAEFIGNSGNSQLLSLDTGNDRIVAYGAYEGGVLVRIALINYNPWGDMTTPADEPTLTTTFGTKPNIIGVAPNGMRPSIDVRIKVDQNVVSQTTKRLTGPLGAYQLANQKGNNITMTYDGKRWDYDTMGQEQLVFANEETNVRVNGRIVPITLDDTSAAVIYLNRS